MHISNIEIKNFKTFKDISVNLNDLNVLIGNCASGKTNFMEALEFLKDISIDFHNAIKKHEGCYLKNFNMADNDGSTLKVRLNIRDDKITVNLDEVVSFLFNQVEYGICFKLEKGSCEVLREIIVFECEVKRQNQIIENAIRVENINGEISAEFEKEMDFLDIGEIIPDILLYYAGNNFKKSNVPLINSALSVFPIEWVKFFKNINSYDLDSKLCKNLDFVANNYALTKYGDNLQDVLISILKDENKRNDFLTFLTNILPYIKDIGIKKVLGEDRIFLIVENYNGVKIPSSYISDGTMIVIALIVALCFQKGNIILIEDVERHICPSVLVKIMSMIESLEDKQIIVTTNSPEVLKHIKLEDICHISRNSSGFSYINRLADNENLKTLIDDWSVDYELKT